MSERSILQLRERPHRNPARAGEVIVEVIRDGIPVAYIYGTKEGIQIVSDCFQKGDKNVPFRFDTAPGVVPMPSYVVPLLAPGEVCPWCGPRQLISCPVCRGEESNAVA